MSEKADRHSEHVIVTYIGEIFREYSDLAYIISIAAGVAILIPVKNRFEQAMKGYFAHMKLEFLIIALRE